MIKKITLFLYISGIAFLDAQVVTMSPPFATQNDNITITFDATQGNGQLAGQSTVYAHTGVITDQSSSGTDWRHVQGNWGTDDAKVKMTSIGNNKFTITYNIASFYGVPSNEKVLKLAFVFRNMDGSLVGRSTDGSDIFVPVSSGGFQILFNSPSTKNSVVNLNDTLTLNATTSAKADLRLYINDSLVKSVLNDSIMVYSSLATSIRNYTIRLTATVTPNTYADSVFFTVRNNRVQYAPAGVVDGINYLNDSTVILQLFAPYKNYVYAIGDFSNWKTDTAFDMIKTPDGNRYWIRLNHLTKAKEYRFQYLIDQKQLRVADPYADKLLDPSNDGSIPSTTYPNLISYPSGNTSEYVSVFQTGQIPFVWQYTSTFVKPEKAKLNIYELLVRDFTGKHNYQALVDTLNYLKTLGINAIEVMPMNEFEGNESWGYNTIFYFAPDKYYGPKEKLKVFVDECHKRGMAVIMDIVLNHNFGQSSLVRMYFDATTGKPAANSPWFNVDPTHPYNVGYDFNHESVYTQALVDTVIKYWNREFKVDGYRFDMSKGFTQKNTGSDVAAWGVYDPSRVTILKRMYDQFKPTCADCYMILEHFADNTEQTILSDYGFMLWGNMNYQYNEATMGFSSDLSGTSYKQFGWKDPNLVTYMESHDEERLQYKNENFGYSNSTYNAKDTNIALSRNAADAVIFLTVPGPKMIWQFGELGYDYSINWCINGTINNACRLDNKPVRWDYLNNPNRKRLHDIYKAMFDLRVNLNAFGTSSYTTVLTGNYKIVRLNDSLLKVMALANMGVTGNSQKPTFVQTGWWYDYFNGDSIYVAHADTGVTLAAGEFRVYTSSRLPKPNITSVVGTQEVEKESQQLMIFPNPASEFIHFSLTHSVNQKVNVELLDFTGKQLHISSPSVQTGNRYTIPTDDLPTGIYFLRVQNGAFYSTQKVIIQRH